MAQGSFVTPMNWTDEYREIVEFYYWEPQHLGRAKGEKRFDGPKDMYEHVNKLEVSLNHILSIFFSLFDISKIKKRLGLPDGQEFASSTQLSEWQEQMKDFTQPDLYFQGPANNLAIELKLGAKIDIPQIAKYIIFNQHVSPDSEALSIVVLSPSDDLVKVTKEKFDSMDELRHALGEYTPSSKALKYCTQEVFQSAVKTTQITLLSIEDFANALKNIQTTTITEERLVNGLLSYLQDRQLIT